MENAGSEQEMLQAASPASPATVNQGVEGQPLQVGHATEAFSLLSCPERVRRRILSYMLVEEDVSITPYYHDGSLEAPDQDIPRENYDISMLLATGNRALYEEALEIFYKGNVWDFRDPIVSRWWLRKIGSKVNLLRHIDITLTSEEVGIARVRSEKLWWNLLAWLKPRVNLSTICVSFKAWDTSSINGLPPNNYPPVRDARLGALRALVSFRGLKEALVIPGKHFGRESTSILEKSMVLEEGRSDEEVEAMELSLG